MNRAQGAGPIRPSRIATTGRAADLGETSWRAAPLGIAVAPRIAAIEGPALRGWRLARLRAELARRDYAGALLADPINIRYATGTRNMQVWTLHAPGRYVFVPTEGPVVMFEFATTRHLARGFESIDELRNSTSWFYFQAGPRVAEKAAHWAGEIASLVHAHGGGNTRLAIDRCEPWGAAELQRLGLSLHDAQEPIERARAIKSPEEIAALRLSMEVCDLAVARMRTALEPGITENQLWAILHETNIAHDGEWIECRLLASGERTNPWFQECANRVIEAGDIVAFDTDMVGPCGYLADISRSFVCPGRQPSDAQKRLYALAEAQVTHNSALLEAGMSFREFVEKSWKVPDAYAANRYMAIVHGVGLVDEYPHLPYAQDFASGGYDGTFEANMVVSVESYIGAEGGGEGIKLEQQVLITESGAEVLSVSPFHDALSA